MQSWKQTFILIKIWFVLNAPGVTAIGAITIGTDGAKSRECFAGVWIFRICWLCSQNISLEILRHKPDVKFRLHQNEITIIISFPIKPKLMTAMLPRTTQDCWMDSNLECTNQDIDFKINENWSDSEILIYQAILNKLLGYYSRDQYHHY